MTSKRCIHKIKDESNDKVTFIILCARKSNNRGYKNIPLSFIDEKQRLIDFQIKTIRKRYRNSEIIIVSGFEHDKLIEYLHTKKYKNIRIAENKNYKTSNTLDGWRFALNIAIKDNCYIIHGDRIFTTCCVKENKTSCIFVHDFDKNNYNLGILHDDDKLINISYGLPDVWSEIFYLRKEDFDIARSILNSKSKKLHNIETFINELSKNIDILVVKRKPTDITVLKEIQ